MEVVSKIEFEIMITDEFKKHVALLISDSTVYAKLNAKIKNVKFKQDRSCIIGENDPDKVTHADLLEV